MADPSSIVDAATAAGINPTLAQYLPRIVQIESGGNPSNQTGSYTGLLQMGPQERAQYGGDGLDSGLRLLKDRADQFEQKFGRPPSPTEFYLTHQQGLGGIAAHMGAPDAPAWQNMAATAEGRQKGAGWAKQAIWGNVPSDLRAQYPGGVDALTSQQFMDLWRGKVERGAAQAPQGVAAGPAQPAQKSVPPPLSANAVGQAQAAPQPYFAPSQPSPGAAGQSPGVDPAAMAAMSPLQAMQLPPAWRPRVALPPSQPGTLRQPFFTRG